MKNVYSILLILTLSACATVSPAGIDNSNTISTDALCTAVFIMVADYEDAKEDTNKRRLAYLDSLAYLISWEQQRLNVSVDFYNKFVKHYKKNMDSPTWLLHWPRCVHRANDIYPAFMEARRNVQR